MTKAKHPKHETHAPISEADQAILEAAVAEARARIHEDLPVPFLAPWRYAEPVPELTPDQRATQYVPPVLSPFPDPPVDPSLIQSVSTYRGAIQPPWDLSLRPGELHVEVPLQDYMKNPRLWVGTRPRLDYYGDVHLMIDNTTVVEASAAISVLAVGDVGTIKVSGDVTPAVDVEAAVFLYGTSLINGNSFWGTQLFGYTIVSDGAGNIDFTFTNVPRGVYNLAVRQRHLPVNMYSATAIVT